MLSNSNGNSNSFSLNAACNTSVTPALSPFITVGVPDGWNAINTVVTLACSGGANSGYANGSRIILDGSYGTNAANGAYASSISFQSQYSGGWTTNALFKTSVVSSVIVVSFYFYGTVFYDGLTSLISDETTKTNIITIDNALDKLDQIRGVYFTSLLDNTNRMGVIAQEVQRVAPEVISTDDKGRLGVCYNSLVGLLLQGIKEQQILIKDLQNRITILENKLI